MQPHSNAILCELPRCILVSPNKSGGYRFTKMINSVESVVAEIKLHPFKYEVEIVAAITNKDVDYKWLENHEVLKTFKSVIFDTVVNFRGDMNKANVIDIYKSIKIGENLIFNFTNLTDAAGISLMYFMNLIFRQTYLFQPFAAVDSYYFIGLELKPDYLDYSPVISADINILFYYKDMDEFLPKYYEFVDNIVAKKKKLLNSIEKLGEKITVDSSKKYYEPFEKFMEEWYELAEFKYGESV